ncbi:MAG: lysine--tRNA ligase [Deltaproteobacteria bacterium]
MTGRGADKDAQQAGGSDSPVETEQVEARLAKLAKLGELREQVYPNDFTPDTTTAGLIADLGQLDGDELESRSGTYRLAGRVMAVRDFGKTSFLSLRDASGALQVYVRRKDLEAGDAEQMGCLDTGDIVGCQGPVFRTRTGELTLRADKLVLLAKCLRPLPEKWHGLTDVETRYRRRYLDLIVNEEARQRFMLRTAIVGAVREFLAGRGFVEVETPMMQALAGGAAAKPFVTHHNALSTDLHLRVAPELYLKRLVVGGFEKVFELNRNFRNEGLSTEHNPEFTMCEFYQTYATYEDLMSLTEELFASLSEVVGTSKVVQGEHEIDLGAPFERMTMAEAVAKHSRLSATQATDLGELEALADEFEIDPDKRSPGLGLLADLFERTAEPHLIQPTFITGFPVEVSPLARASDNQPGFVDRFELFAGGRELANGFSELNDPAEQKARFLEQLRLREAGDDEAHAMDEDFVRALEYGMPPTAGEGIGIDRVVMLLTGTTSIRDVILFPQMRPGGRR